MVIDYIDIYQKLSENVGDISDEQFEILLKMEEWVDRDPRLFSIPCETCKTVLVSVDKGEKNPIIKCPLCNNEFSVDRRKIKYENV